MACDAFLVGTHTTGTGTTLTTGAGNVNNGETLVIVSSYGASTATASNPRDSTGANTYTAIGTVQLDNASTGGVMMWYASNVTGGASVTASLDFSANPNGVIYLIRITGVTTASFDKNAQGVDTATPFTVTTPTLTQANELILTVAGIFGSASGSVESSVNTAIIDQETDAFLWWNSAVSKFRSESTAAVTPSFTTSGTSVNGAAMKVATFMEVAGTAQGSPIAWTTA